MDKDNSRKWKENFKKSDGSQSGKCESGYGKIQKRLQESARFPSWGHERQGAVGQGQFCLYEQRFTTPDESLTPTWHSNRSKEIGNRLQCDSNDFTVPVHPIIFTTTTQLLIHIRRVKNHPLLILKTKQRREKKTWTFQASSFLFFFSTHFPGDQTDH